MNPKQANGGKNNKDKRINQRNRKQKTRGKLMKLKSSSLKRSIKWINLQAKLTKKKKKENYQYNITANPKDFKRLVNEY